MPTDWAPSIFEVRLSVLGVLILVISPWRPIIGLLVFIVLGYGFPRVGYNFTFFLRWHVLEIVSILSALGYGIWCYDKKIRPVWIGNGCTLLFLSLLAWILITTIIAVVHGNYIPAANHHPVLMLNALVMFALAAEFFKTTVNQSLISGTLALTLCLRCLLAPQWITGNGDLGVLLSISIPLTLGCAVTIRPYALSSLFVLLLVIQGVLLFITMNRGGLVAIIMASLTVWLLCRSRLRNFLIALLVLIFVGTLFIRTAYWKKFADIWQDGYWKKTVDSRINLWEGGWRMALDYPVFGVGLGNFEHRVGGYTKNGKSDSPHNNIIGFLTETGFTGAVLYLAFFLRAICMAALASHRIPPTKSGRFAVFLAAALMSYLVGGMFLTRHTMTLAYLLAGGALAVSMSVTEFSYSTTK